LTRTQLYVLAVSPADAADRAERDYRSTHPPSWLKKKYDVGAFRTAQASGRSTQLVTAGRPHDGPWQFARDERGGANDASNTPQ